MSSVEVKPYGGVRRPALLFQLPEDIDYAECVAFADSVRVHLPNIDFAVFNEAVRVTIIDTQGRANTTD